MITAPKATFDFKKQNRTTGWHNNCGFNCLSHLFASKLESQELQRLFSQDPQYAMLLQTFQEYYGLSNQPTWEQLNILRQQYPVATDWEAILAPVFRKHLEKLLINNAEYLWEKLAPAAVSAYLVSGTVSDVAEPLFNAMIGIMGELKASYDHDLKALEQLPPYDDELNVAAVQLFENQIVKKEINPTPEELFAQVKFQRKNDLQDSLQAKAKAYWMQNGCQFYAQAVGDLQGDVMASADQLDLLAQALHIGLEVHTLAGAQNLPLPGFVWLLKTFNSGAHWTFEGENAERHNQYYPDKFTVEFIRNDALSGKFKTYGGAGKGLEGKIIADVKAAMETMFILKPVPVILSAFKATVPALTQSLTPVVDVKQVAPVVKVAPSTTVDKENAQNGLAMPMTIHHWLALPEDQMRALYNTSPAHAKIVTTFFEVFGLGPSNFDGFLALIKLLNHPTDRDILFGPGDTSKADPKKSSIINASLNAVAQAQKADIDMTKKDAIIKQLIQTIYQRKIVPALLQQVVSALTKAKI